MAPRGPSERPLKKNEKPLVCFVRLYGTERRRMQNVCRKFSTDHNAVAKAGIGSELLRLEQHAEALTPEISKAVAEANALGIDPLECLRTAIAEKVSNPETR